MVATATGIAGGTPQDLAAVDSSTFAYETHVLSRQPEPRNLSQVRAYMERTVADARERGYTETLFGRRRPIPELSASNFRIRQAGERQAMNAGIQGLAADIFKVALVRIEAALEDAGLASRLILQVHDEVLLDVPPAEREAATDLVVEAMGHAADLRVPLDVNLAFGPTWADAKG